VAIPAGICTVVGINMHDVGPELVLSKPLLGRREAVTVASCAVRGGGTIDGEVRAVAVM